VPGIRIHLDQAAHNEAFFTAIDLGVYSDWAVTALFYSALHYVDAYLAQEGYADPGDHDVRDDLMKRFATTRAIWQHYRRLKSFSRSARYYAIRFTRHEITGLQRGSFEPIKAQIEKVLATPS
jgi:hypothetical protein